MKTLCRLFAYIVVIISAILFFTGIGFGFAGRCEIGLAFIISAIALYLIWLFILD